MIVVKVGGSLFDHPGLRLGLSEWLSPLLRQQPVRLVPGGGDIADVVRRMDATHKLGEEFAHWAALRSLAVSALLLRALVPDATIIDGYDFARSDDGQPGSLPHAWAVTSDSLAARVAVVCNASKLVLLKSVDIPPETPWAEAATRGWVDAYFPSAVKNVTFEIEAINFRRWLEERSSQSQADPDE